MTMNTLTPEGQKFVSNMVAGHDADVRRAALDEALEAIQSLRHQIAATFTPESSGQRGQDKTDVLYEAYQAVAKLKQ